MDIIDPVDPRVRVAADAYARSGGWPLDDESEDYKMALETANIIVGALEEAGYLQ